MHLQAIREARLAGILAGLGLTAQDVGVTDGGGGGVIDPTDPTAKDICAATPGMAWTSRGCVSTACAPGTSFDFTTGFCEGPGVQPIGPPVIVPPNPTQLCPPGFQMVNGQCTPISTITPGNPPACPTGQTLVDNVCVPNTPIGVTCPIGYEFFGGRCIPTNCPQVSYPACPDGTSTVPYAGADPCGGPPTCHPIGNVCPPGWQFDVFGNCANANSIAPTSFNPCPAGFQLNAANQCMPALTPGNYVNTQQQYSAPPSWLGQSTIIGNVPNWLTVAGGALAAVLITKAMKGR